MQYRRYYGGDKVHIRYGMTTNSVHMYVVELLKKLGIDEGSITKFQTGGPDGDLGSNEILISKDKTTVGNGHNYIAHNYVEHNYPQ